MVVFGRRMATLVPCSSWNCLGAGFHCRHTALNSAPEGQTPILRSGWPCLSIRRSRGCSGQGCLGVSGDRKSIKISKILTFSGCPQDTIMDPDEAPTDPETTLLAPKWCFLAAGWPSCALLHVESAVGQDFINATRRQIARLMPKRRSGGSSGQGCLGMPRE